MKLSTIKEYFPTPLIAIKKIVIVIELNIPNFLLQSLNCTLPYEPHYVKKTQALLNTCDLVIKTHDPVQQQK